MPHRLLAHDSLTRPFAALFLLLLIGSPAGQAPSGGPAEGWRAVPGRGTVPVAPPTSALPPELPEAAHNISPATIDLVLRLEGTQEVLDRQTVTRTAARVHVRLGAGREWLYVRNPLDPRRVSGAVADHGQKAVILYSESELRNWQGLRGWVDILALGGDGTIADTQGAGTPVRWFDAPGGRAVLAVERIDDRIDRDLLADLEVRYTDYRVVDLSEWLEHR